MRHRLAVALISLGVILSSLLPLYRAVKQEEFIPTNVDEAEFEISVNSCMKELTWP